MILTNILKKKNKKTAVLNLLLFIVGLSIPFSYAFNSIAIGSLFLYSFIWFEKGNYSFSWVTNRFQIHLLFLIYFSLQFIGVFYSENLSLGFSFLIQNIVFLILPLTFINLSKILDYEKVKFGIYGMVIGVHIILFSIHINILFQIFSQNLGFESLIYYFVRLNFVQAGLVEIHPPYFGLMVVFSLLVILNTTFYKDITLNGIVKYSLSTYLLVSLYGISSFMSIVLVFLLFIIYLFFLVKKKKTKVLISILLSILIVIITIGTLKNTNLINKFPGESLLGRIEWSFVKGKGDTSRPENWRSVLIVVKEHPLIGVGTYGGLNYLQENRNKTSESFKNGHNAHNQYLETLLRHGIIGLFVYLFIIYKLILSAIKSRNFIFCGFVFIFIVASITESYLVRQIGLTFFTFYALLFSTFYNFGYNKKNAQ
jgi:O-antigen ligase